MKWSSLQEETVTQSQKEKMQLVQLLYQQLILQNILVVI
jgi:hypothetical protein